MSTSTPESESSTSNLTPLLSTSQLIEENGANRHVVSITEVDPRLTLTLNDTSVNPFI